MLGKWGAHQGRQIKIISLHLKRRHLWLVLQVWKQLPHEYMGRVEGCIWAEVSNGQNRWKGLPEDVHNSHGTWRRCGGLLWAVDQA